MNANELAVELEHYLKGEEYDRLVWEIPDLLRQQQAELKELKLARLADLDVILKQRAEIELLFKEIPEFEKVFSNEPVAYGKYLEEHDYWVTASGIIPDPKEGYVPLYTHPAKTLTDEEIISSAEEAGFNWSEDKGIFVRHSNGSWIGLDSKMVDFARAILRKAQEK